MYRTAPVVCENCCHRWQAVGPVPEGMLEEYRFAWLECPLCSHMTGHEKEEDEEEYMTREEREKYDAGFGKGEIV